jgi:glycosyltransferase involved in cell wall biosynthesis
MATLSLCMIVKDEENFLANAIGSVREIADEIIVVDNGSADSSRDIAKGMGAKVLLCSKAGDFSHLRNLSLSNATSNWILVLDADEMIDENGRAEILRLINNRENCLSDIIGFKLEQRTYHVSGDRTGKVTTDPAELHKSFNGHESSNLVRLFKKHPRIEFRSKVHELVEPSIRESNGRITDSGITIHHFSELKGKNVQADKARKYTDLIWKQLDEEPLNPKYNYRAAQAFIGAGRKDLALKYLVRTAKLDPKYKGIYSDIGKINLEMGNASAAVRFFNVAIATDKSDTSAMNNLAVIYMNAGRYDAAEKLLSSALQKNPENPALKDNYEVLKKLKKKK